MAGSKEEKHFTLMFVRKGVEVLLGRRKRGHVNIRGKWNGTDLSYVIFHVNYTHVKVL